MELNAPTQVKREVNDNDVEDGRPSTVKPISDYLSDGSRIASPSSTYKHSWTREQRFTLIMLAETYSNTWKDLTLAFNHIYKSDLQRCAGLRKAVVSTQYHDLRKRFGAAASLERMKHALSPYERSKLITRPQVEKKANEIGVRLRARVPAHSTLSNEHRRKTKFVDTIDDSRTDFLPENSWTIPTLPKTPTKGNGKDQDTGLRTPPNSREHKLPRFTTDKRLASIGFRAITSQSQGIHTLTLGIRAGAFLDCPRIPRAQDLDLTRYREEALHHITFHDHSRPSMFVSATKNPMRALHRLLRAPPGQNDLVVIDLNAADEHGNVQKAHDLKLRTTFRYSAAGEYLIFGGVAPSAIISTIPLSRLVSSVPITPNDDDPFKFKILQAHEKVSSARYAIRKEISPMTYALGRAVGQLVGILCIPPKHFESGVWSLCQDYKFYNAEGGKKRGHWANNTAFRDGAVQGYQSVLSNTPTSLQIGNNVQSAREIIEIADDSNPDDDSDEDDFMPVDVEDWVSKTFKTQSSLQYYDLERGHWTTQEEDLGDNFLAELRDIAGNLDENGLGIGGDNPAGNTMNVSQNAYQLGGVTSNSGFSGLEMDISSMIEDSAAAPATAHMADPEEFSNLDELCADVMHMHGDELIRPVQTEQDMEIDYGFSWTGM